MGREEDDVASGEEDADSTVDEAAEEESGVAKDEVEVAA